MHAEWTVECGADDPVLVVPWSSDSSSLPESTSARLRFVDLREDPYALDQIPEAELHLPLMQALRALNAARSPVFTAKCDAWVMDTIECEAMLSNLDVSEVEGSHGFCCYVDLVLRDRPLFLSFHHQEQRLQRLTRLLEPLDHPYAAVECVLRSALVDLTGPQEGFSITLYVKALGTDPPHAYDHWTRALEGVVLLLRSKDFSLG